MQVNKVQINNIYSASVHNNNKSRKGQLSFEGDSFRKSDKDSKRPKKLKGPVAFIKSRMALDKAERLKQNGEALLLTGKNVIIASRWFIKQAKGELKEAQSTLDELNEKGKGIINHSNGTNRAVLNRDELTELDDKRNIIRYSFTNEDRNEISETEYIKNGVRKVAIKMPNGIKIMSGVGYPKDDVMTADEVYFFDELGNLKKYLENYAKKSDENKTSSKADLRINYKNGTPYCISTNVKSKQDTSTADFKYSYSGHGDILSVEVNPKTDNSEDLAYKSCDKKFQYKKGRLKRVSFGLKTTPYKTTLKEEILFSETGAPKALYK